MPEENSNPELHKNIKRLKEELDRAVAIGLPEVQIKNLSNALESAKREDRIRKGLSR